MKKIFYILPLAAVMMTACMEQKETATTFKTNEPVEAVEVTAKVVESKMVPQIAEFTANLEANKVNKIAPQAPTRIRKINVEVGDRVSAGQVLVELDETSLIQSKLQLETQKLELKRAKELLAVGGASQSVVDALQAQVEVLEAQYGNLVENATLKSPISGVVSARNYDAGDLYQGSPVLEVQQIAPVKVIININEQYYSLVKEGMKMDHITLDAFPGELFSGRVSIKYPTLDPSTRTFKAEIKMDNNSQKARPGMFARVQLNFGEENRVLVPDQAVVKQGGSGERYVYVIEGNKVRRQIIELGRRLGKEYEVVEGLKPGDQVVVFGQNKLADGREVIVKK